MWGGSSAVWKRRFSCYGPWETSESCVVLTATSVYRRLQDGGGREEPWGPPGSPPTPGSPPPGSGRLLKSESEDSGVELASNENSPSTPLGSESGFSLDGPQPAPGDAAKSPWGGQERGTEPPRPLRSRKPGGAQRSRRQRQLSRRSAGTRDPQEPPKVGDPEAAPEALAGQGLRYLEHICQLLERLARLQHDNRLLRLQAEARRHTGTAPPREALEQDLATWRGERFRARSCSDSHAPAQDPVPCSRHWGHSASSPSLLEPCDSPPLPDKDGGSHWGRVKVLLTRLTRRSLRGGRCR